MFGLVHVLFALLIGKVVQVNAVGAVWEYHIVGCVSMQMAPTVQVLNFSEFFCVKVLFNFVLFVRTKCHYI